MAINIVSSRNFIINDEDILAIINNMNIKYLKFTIKKDYDNSLIISASIIICDNESDISKYCTKIYHTDHCFIRTPSILLPYIGERISYYRDKTIFKDSNELFKIKPIDFQFLETGFKNTNYKEYPYFTNSGVLVFPKTYINKYFDIKIILYKLSFDNNDTSIIQNGNLYTYFCLHNEHRYFSFKLKKTKTGISTGIINNLLKILNSCKKNITDFKYDSIIFNNEFKHGFITFKEKK